MNQLHIHMIPIVYITSLISIQISEKYMKLCARLASALAAATTLSVLTKKIAAGCHISLVQPHWQNNTENKPFLSYSLQSIEDTVLLSPKNNT